MNEKRGGKNTGIYLSPSFPTLALWFHFILGSSALAAASSQSVTLKEASIRVKPAHGEGPKRINRKGKLDQSVPEAYTLLGFSLCETINSFHFTIQFKSYVFLITRSFLTDP